MGTTPAQATVDQTLVTAFAQQMHMEAAQTMERTRPHVEFAPFKGKDYSHHNLGSVEAKEITGRFQPVDFGDLDHSVRQLANRRFKVSLPLDDKDDLEMIVDRDSPYRARALEALKRQFDKIVLEAALASIQTGANFATTVTAAADGVVTLDATAGFNYATMLQIKETFIDNEVGIDGDKGWALAISGGEHTSLMNEEKLTSGDYSREYFVEGGSIQKALGGDILLFGGGVANPLLAIELAATAPSGNDERHCIAMCNGGVKVGIVEDFTLDLYDDRRYYDTRVIEIGAMMGAVRTEGVKIIKIRTTA